MKTYKSITSVIVLSLTAQIGFCMGATNPPAKDIPSKKVGQSSVPAYVDYTPFEWESYRTVPRQEFADGLHKAIRIGFDKAQSDDTQISMVRVSSLDDIQAFKALLKAPQNAPKVKYFGDTRFLFDADRGETQIFVDRNGIVSQGTHLWQISPADFVQLKQILKRIYASASAVK